jgi:hypothetical protein
VTKTANRAAVAVAVLFFVKASVLALFVTPLWDVPDEIGHLAYAAGILDGRGVPPPGGAVIPRELAERWTGRPLPGPIPNWTSIHPPGFELLAAGALAGARAATPDFEWQVRLTRLPSALFGALTIFLLFRLLVLAGARSAAALGGATAVAFIPMFSHMSSGISPDALSAALGALAAIAWVRVVRLRTYSAALALALALAAAGAVKPTVAPVLLAVAVLLPPRLPGRPAAKLLAAAGVSALAASTSALWLFRLGRVPAVASGPPAVRRHGLGAFLDAFRDLPLLDHTFKNFFGLMGWTGGGGARLRWFQISGAFLAVEFVLVLAMAALAVAWIWRLDFENPAAPPGLAWAAWAAAGAALLLSTAWLCSRPATAAPKLVAESMIFAVPFLSVSRIWRRRTEAEEIVFSSQFVVLVFTCVYLANVVRSYLPSGQMRGAHGRYFFVVLGFLLLALYLPAVERLRAWPRWRSALAVGVGAQVLNEAAFYALRVIPFYRRR